MTTIEIKRTNNAARRGVSLVEVAIVLVIIAVLLMALTAGRNLLRAGKVRAIVSEVENYRGAFTRFEDKYTELPGDMTQAESYFNATETQNGNGNELITWGIGSEGPLAWQHLQLANMIGAAEMAGTGANAIVDVNIPASKIAGAGYYVDYDDNTVGNHLGLGRPDGNGLSDGAAVKPEDAYNIDSKLDDGLTTTGRIRGRDGTNTTECRLTSNNTQYNLIVTTEQCVLIFQLDNALQVPQPDL